MFKVVFWGCVFKFGVLVLYSEFNGVVLRVICVSKCCVCSLVVLLYWGLLLWVNIVC